MAKESAKAFMKRLRKQDEERRANSGQNFPPAVVLRDLKTNTLYRVTCDQAWAFTKGEYDDCLGINILEGSPIAEGYDYQGENQLYFNRGQMRSLRSIVFRDYPDDPTKERLVAGVSPKDKTEIKVGVPKLEGPVNIQFVVVEDEPKQPDQSGFKHIIGEVVDEWPDAWEDPGKFVSRLQKEKQDYLDAKFAENQVDGQRIGGTEMGTEKIITAHVTEMFPSSDGTFGIVKIDPEKSPLWEGYNVETDGVFNRFHMSGPTLKTFRKGVLTTVPEDRDDTADIFVGKMRNDSGEEIDDFIKPAAIPEGGVTVQFFREDRYPLGEDGKPDKSRNPYKVCLGEVIEG